MYPPLSLHTELATDLHAERLLRASVAPTYAVGVKAIKQRIQTSVGLSTTSGSIASGFTPTSLHSTISASKAPSRT